MTFRAGQKVVCVDAATRGFYPSHLSEGAVYTVRGFCESRLGEIGVLLDEVRPDYPRLQNGHERGFHADRFRPAVERRTSIEIFTRLLVPGSKVSEPV